MERIRPRPMKIIMNLGVEDDGCHHRGTEEGHGEVTWGQIERAKHGHQRKDREGWQCATDHATKTGARVLLAFRDSPLTKAFLPGQRRGRSAHVEGETNLDDRSGRIWMFLLFSEGFIQ
uniref:Uncharacterized protein n=1 Tax=Panagrellus redivivus TaxID=6233 RepID=A0A7E4VH63_PANRE